MKKIIEPINNNKKIRLLIYSLNRTNSDRIKKVLALYLNQYECNILLGPIFTCVKELAINAIRANYKNIFFENYSTKKNPDKTIEYEIALKIFNLEMSRDDANNFVRLARDKNIGAEIFFGTNNDLLDISVENPVSLTMMELKNIKKKLEDAKSCEDISDYFLLTQDDPDNENAGIGLVLISMILKSLGADQSSLHIFSKDGYTKASISIPLNSDTLGHYYESTRMLTTSETGK